MYLMNVILELCENNEFDIIYVLYLSSSMAFTDLNENKNMLYNRKTKDLGY